MGKDNPEVMKQIENISDLVMTQSSEDEISIAVIEIEELSEAIEDILQKSILLFYLALGLLAINSFDDSIKHNERVLEMLNSRTFSDPKVSNLKSSLISGCLVDIGKAYFMGGNFEKAKEYFFSVKRHFKSSESLVDEDCESFYKNDFLLTLCEGNLSISNK